MRIPKKSIEKIEKRVKVEWRGRRAGLRCKERQRGNESDNHGASSLQTWELLQRNNGTISPLSTTVNPKHDTFLKTSVTDIRETHPTRSCESVTSYFLKLRRRL